MKELLDITTRHTSGEEAVGDVFIQDNGKAAPGSGWGAPLKTTEKGTKSSAKGDKMGLKQQPQWVAVTTNCDEGDNDKEAGDSNNELVVGAHKTPI
jgi:hypothetical protein